MPRSRAETTANSAFLLVATVQTAPAKEAPTHSWAAQVARLEIQRLVQSAMRNSRQDRDMRSSGSRSAQSPVSTYGRAGAGVTELMVARQKQQTIGEHRAAAVTRAFTLDEGAVATRQPNPGPSRIGIIRSTAMRRSSRSIGVDVRKHRVFAREVRGIVVSVAELRGRIGRSPARYADAADVHTAAALFDTGPRRLLLDGAQVFL